MTHRDGSLRAAIVGAGLMGRWHADAIERAGGSVEAIVDVDPGRAGHLRRRVPRAAAVADLRALAASRIDVVHVCAPLAAHEMLTLDALDLGAHVVVEKPLAADLGATRRLLDRAAAAERLLCPVHQIPFQRGASYALARLADVGELVRVEATICSAGAEGGGAPDALVADMLPHPLSLLARIPGLAIADAVWSVHRSKPGEWQVSGVVAGVAVSLYLSASGRPTRHAAMLIGTRGTFHLDFFHGFAVFERGAVSRLRKVVRPLSLAAATARAAGWNLVVRAATRQPAYPGLRELVRRLYDALRHRSAPPISAAETIAVAALRDSLTMMALPP